MVALNEIDYIDAVLNSVKPYCDKIVVIESCARKPFDYLYKEGFVTKDGLSTDGTTEYLQRRNDITYLPMYVLEGTVEACASPQFHKYVTDGDYIWIGTGNEVYFPKKAKEIHKMIMSGVPYIDVSLVVMWKDLKHRIVGGGWDSAGLRIFQYEKSLDQPFDFDVKTCTAFPMLFKFGQIYIRYKYQVLDACMKLAYARSEQRVFYKVALQDIEYNDRLNNLGRYKSLEVYLHRTHHWWNDIHAKGIAVKRYRGKYPEGV